MSLGHEKVALTLDTEILDEAGEIWRIRATAKTKKNVTISLSSEVCELQAGASLLVFQSTRFTLEVLPKVMARAGLEILEHWVFDGEEGIFRVVSGG